MTAENMTKDLKSKAISIKGKDYVQVKDRIIFFNENYPNGAIVTELLSDPTANMVVVRATVTPDISIVERRFTGHSQARWDDKSSMVNSSSAMENAETSAVGRALALMGIGVIDSIASSDEIHKANHRTDTPQPENKTGLEVICDVCKARMVEKSGTKKDGTEWHGYFCPNSTKENQHPPRWI